MNFKKIFFSMMMVSLAATMSVGFSSCDRKKDPVDHSHLIIDSWRCVHNLGAGHRIEFKEGSTYSWGNPNLEPQNGAGNYRILATFENKEVRLGDRKGDPRKATLFIIEVSPNDVFDQLWVYHYYSASPREPVISVEYYSNNELLTDFLWSLLKVD